MAVASSVGWNVQNRLQGRAAILNLLNKWKSRVTSIVEDQGMYREDHFVK